MPGTLTDASKQVSHHYRGKQSPHEAAKRRMVEFERRGVFRSDWLRALMIHLEVDGDELQRHTPFEIDLFQGRAFVSLVAFEMCNFRPRGTGMLGSLIFAPATRHRLFNVRTYVRHEGEPGICFLTEWVPNRLSAFLGPRLFGLPYRLGRLQYNHDSYHGRLEGVIQSFDRQLACSYRARLESNSAAADVAGRGSFAEFLFERYTAFTLCRGRRRFFRIWHEPWEIQKAEVELLDRSLLAATGHWLLDGKIAGADYSHGVRNVWIGLPHRC